MPPEPTHDVETIGEIDELERKVGELRAARAQMIAERDEHVRNAQRAAAVLGGLAQIRRELDILARERAEASVSAAIAREQTTREATRLREASEAAASDVEEHERRLGVVRERVDAIARERETAALAASEAIANDERCRAQHDETARAAADVALKYEAALAETTIAEGRNVQFTDIEETLDREQQLAEARLLDVRVRAETRQVEADLKRVRDEEQRLANERTELERRLRAMRSQAEIPLVAQPIPAAPRPAPAHVAASDAQPVHHDGRTPQRVTLAARLMRDLIHPGTSA